MASISGTPKCPARIEKSPSPSCAERRAIASSGRASRRACSAASATAVSTPPRLSAAISSHARRTRACSSAIGACATTDPPSAAPACACTVSPPIRGPEVMRSLRRVVTVMRCASGM